MSTGTAIRVRYGPLRGLEGFIQEVKNGYQLIISVTLLSRSVSVAIDRDCVMPIYERQPQPALV